MAARRASVFFATWNRVLAQAATQLLPAGRRSGRGTRSAGRRRLRGSAPRARQLLPPCRTSPWSLASRYVTAGKKNPTRRFVSGACSNAARGAHSTCVGFFSPLVWTPTVFGTDQLNRVVACVQAWRRVSSERARVGRASVRQRMHREGRGWCAGYPERYVGLAQGGAPGIRHAKRCSVGDAGPGLVLIAVRRASPRCPRARPRRPGIVIRLQ